MNPSIGRGWAFWLLLPGVFFEAFNTLRVSGGVTVGDALILAAGCLTLIDAARRGTRLWLPWWILIGLPIFAAGPIVDVLFVGAGYRDDFVYAATLMFCIFVIPVVIASQRQHASSAEWLLQAWAAGLAVGAFVAVLQFHHWQPAVLDRWMGWRPTDRIPGMNSNPNILGEGLAIGIPACLALALGSNAWMRAWIWICLWALCFYAADLSGSRAAIAGGILGSLATATLFVVKLRVADIQRHIVRLALLAAAVIVFLSLRGQQYDSAIARLFGHSETAQISSWMRSELANIALRNFGDAPFFGNGYGWLTYKAHNVPLVLLQCGGVFGFTGFLLTQIGFALYAARSFILWLRHDVLSTWVPALLGCWFAWIFLSMFQAPILHRHAHIVFGLSILWWSIAQRAVRAERPAVVPDWSAGAAPGQRPL